MRDLNSRIIFLYFLSMLMLTPSVYAQENTEDSEQESKAPAGKAKLIISGNVYVDGLRLDQVLVTLLEDNQVVDEVRTDENGKFKIEISLDKMQLIEFSKEEYIGKSVDVDTRNVPEGERRYDYYNKGWKVDLYPADLDVDFNVLKKPVAKIVFNPSNGEFSIDKKYEKSVRPALERLSRAAYAAYEQGDMDSEDAFDDYMLAVKDGDAFLKEGDYENALMQYEAAKEILPNESYPDKQIKKTMAIMQSNASVDELYANHLQTADDAFGSKEWDLARKSYEQASDVKPKMEYPKDQIDLIIKNIAEEKLLASKMKDKERLDLYNRNVASADSLLALKLYAKSKVKFAEAGTVLPKKEYPKTKIKEIDALLASNAKAEDAYTKLLANANSFLNNREYAKAKAEYTNALGIRPEDELPKAKIVQIDGLLAGLAALKAKELEMAANKEAAMLAKYEGLIVSADALMVDKSYDLAKADYEKALLIKSDNVYPKNQILLINKTLAEIEGVDKQYEKLMSSAVKNGSVNKYELAKNDYLAALRLKPNEQAPKDGVASMEAKLLAVQAGLDAKQKAIDDKYNGFVADGDALLAVEKLAEAENAYVQALTVKPKESYPKAQIAAIKDKLSVLAAASAASEKEAKLLAEKTRNYNAAIGKADQMYKSGNLVGAKSGYQNALTILSEKAYPVSQIAEIDGKLELAAATLAETQRKEAALKAQNEEYEAVIAKADAYLVAKNYVQARLEYQNAQKILSEKTYPASQIEKIEKLELADKQAKEQAILLAAQNEENQKRFNEIVKEGDAFVAEGDLQKGKYKYEAALKIISGDAVVTKKMRDLSAKIEEERKLAAFQAKNDTEFNRQLAEMYPDGLNETTKKSGKTITRIVVVAKGRGDEYKKEVYSYGAIFYFKNGKKVDEGTFKRETKGH